MRKLILFFALIVFSLFLMSNVLAQSTFSAPDTGGIKIVVSSQLAGQQIPFENICHILDTANTLKTPRDCDPVQGIILMNLEPLNPTTIEEVRAESGSFADMLEVYSAIATINKNYGHGGRIFTIQKDHELIIEGDRISTGIINFSTDVPVGNLLNPDYGPTRIFIKGELDFDRDQIVLESNRGEKYYRAGFSGSDEPPVPADRFIPQGTSLTIKPITGFLTMDMSESGKFSMFGKETFIPEGSRLRVATASNFDVYYDHSPNNIHVSATPTGATSFSIVPDGGRLWLNGGNGYYTLVEHELYKPGEKSFGIRAFTFDMVRSYDLNFGTIGRGVQRDGSLSFEPQILRGDKGEILVSKTAGTTTTYDPKAKKWILGDIVGGIITLIKTVGEDDEDIRQAAAAYIRG